MPMQILLGTGVEKMQIKLDHICQEPDASSNSQIDQLFEEVKCKQR